MKMFLLLFARAQGRSMPPVLRRAVGFDLGGEASALQYDVREERIRRNALTEVHVSGKFAEQGRIHPPSPSDMRTENQSCSMATRVGQHGCQDGFLRGTKAHIAKIVGDLDVHGRICAEVIFENVESAISSARCILQGSAEARGHRFNMAVEPQWMNTKVGCVCGKPRGT